MRGKRVAAVALGGFDVTKVRRAPSSKRGATLASAITAPEPMQVCAGSRKVSL
jgi:hypothetical protein